MNEEKNTRDVVEDAVHTCRMNILKTVQEVLGTMSEIGAIAAVTDNFIEVPDSLRTWLRQRGRTLAGKTSVVSFWVACGHRWRTSLGYVVAQGEPVDGVEELRSFFRKGWANAGML